MEIQMDNLICKLLFFLHIRKLLFTLQLTGFHRKCIGKGFKRGGEGVKRHIIVFILSVFHFHFPLIHLPQLGIIAFAIFYAHCACARLGILSSNVFIHKNCIFICKHTHRYTDTHAHTHTAVTGKQGNRPQMVGHGHKLTFLFEFSDLDTDCQLYQFFQCALTLRERVKEMEM